MKKLKRKKYRYLGCGTARPEDPINEFRLLASNFCCMGSSFYRVEILPDLKLQKYSCDSYSTTKDTRTLEQLNATPYIKINYRFYQIPELKHWRPCDWFEILRRVGVRLNLGSYQTEAHIKDIRKNLEDLYNNQIHIE